MLRRDDGSIAAFHNTCRHRGSRILQHDSGVAGATLMCPYHRWSYDLEGQVVGCGATGELPRAQPPLKPVHVKLLAGLIFVCMSDAPPPDFDDMAQRMAPYLAPHALKHTKVARQVDIIEHGNWKLTIENNRECFHCAGHPELLRSLFDFFGEVDESRHVRARAGQLLPLPWRPHRIRSVVETLRAAVAADRGAARAHHRLSHRAPGARWRRGIHDARYQAASRRLLGEFTQARLGSLHYHVQPNAWFHFLSDHVLTFAALPLARDSTLVRSTWLVHADAEEGVDYDLENLTSVWNATNAQDAAFVAETQRGVTSPAYLPGPIGANEYMVNMFHAWYEERMRAALQL